MRALSVTNSAASRDRLLKMAEATPGAWMGIRIAAVLLILKGGTVVKWLNFST